MRMSDESKNGSESTSGGENSTALEETKVELLDDGSNDTAIALSRDVNVVNEELNQPLGLFSNPDESQIGGSIPPLTYF